MEWRSKWNDQRKRHKFILSRKPGPQFPLEGCLEVKRSHHKQRCSHRFTVHIAAECILHCTNEETIDHLFSGFSLTSYTWQMFPVGFWPSSGIPFSNMFVIKATKSQRRLRRESNTFLVHNEIMKRIYLPSRRSMPTLQLVKTKTIMSLTEWNFSNKCLLQVTDAGSNSGICKFPEPIHLNCRDRRNC